MRPALEAARDLLGGVGAREASRVRRHLGQRLTIGQQMRLVIVPYTTRADGIEVMTFAFAPAGDEEE